MAFPKRSDRVCYGRLLDALNTTPFRFSIPMDENRMTDGIDLRYRFCYERGLPNDILEGVTDPRSCSVLEMMIALSLKCDEHIMYDSDFGGRTDRWFFEMIVNLGLEPFTNDRFDPWFFNQTMNRFLSRKYAANGFGGLFVIPNLMIDLRNVEIWYQMQWYLNDILNKGA